MSYPYFPFTYPTNIGYEGWRPYIQSQYMLDVIRRVAARNSEDSYEIYCHYRPGDISLTSSQAAEILAKYEQHGQAYVYCDGDEDPDVTKSNEFLPSLFSFIIFCCIVVVFLNIFWYFTKKMFATKTNDNIQSPEDDIFVEVDDIPLDIPKRKLVFQVWQKHYSKAMRIFDENGVARDYDYGFDMAFEATLMEYEFHIKKQLKTVETALNGNEQKIDRRFASNDSFFFPMRRYQSDQEWNCDPIKQSNIPLPDRNVFLQELKDNIEDALLSCDETGHRPVEIMFLQAFDETILSYTIEVNEQLELQEPILTKYEERIKRKIAEIEKIECMTYFEKVKLHFKLKRQYREKQKNMTKP